jgi:hypothetical protein
LIAHGLFWKCAEQVGVEVVALFLLWLVFFDLDPKEARLKQVVVLGKRTGPAHFERNVRESVP